VPTSASWAARACLGEPGFCRKVVGTSTAASGGHVLGGAFVSSKHAFLTFGLLPHARAGAVIAVGYEEIEKPDS